MKFFNYNLPIFENNIVSSPLIRFSGVHTTHAPSAFPTNGVTVPYSDSFSYNPNSPLYKNEAEIKEALNASPRAKEIMAEINKLMGENS